MPVKKPIVPKKSRFREIAEGALFKSVVGTVAGLVIIGGGFTAVDDRYAHAADLKEINGKLEMNRLTAEVSVMEIRRATLSDKIFEAEQRPAQQAKPYLDRYNAELRELTRDMATKKALLDQLKAGK